MKRLSHTAPGTMLLLLAVVTLLGACKPARPGGILSPGEMEDVLYDYHLAIGLAQTEGNGDAVKELAYKDAVLRKHGVGQDELDSSMVYYVRHADQLHTIYAALSDRLDKEAVSLGANASDLSRYGNLASTGDTANIWKGASSLVLVTHKPLNYYNFEIKADSSFHKGDCFMLDFDAQFIFQDGNRDGLVALAVQFANDSVASQTIRVQSSQSFTVRVEDRDTLGIKAVRGYFLLNNGDFTQDGGSATTLKLMFVERIRLIRMHSKKAEEPAVANADSAKVQKDSIGKSGVQQKDLRKLEPGQGTVMQAEPIDGRTLPPPPPANRPLSKRPLKENATMAVPREMKKINEADIKPIRR